MAPLFVTSRKADNDGFLAAVLAALDDFGRAGMRSARRALDGYDPVTGEPVLQTERALTLLGGALPVGRAAAKAAPPPALLAGRQADAVERGLSAAQVERLAGLLTDGVTDAPAALAAGEKGALAYRMPADGAGRWSAAGHLRPETMRIELAGGLDAATRARVLAHEVGHALDMTAGASASIAAAPPAAARGLPTLSQRYRPEAWLKGPTAYAADPAETVADALALYLTDPAAAKAAAPETAAWLRRVMAADDAVRRHVIFNARPAGASGALWEDP